MSKMEVANLRAVDVLDRMIEEVKEGRWCKGTVFCLENGTEKRCTVGLLSYVGGGVHQDLLVTALRTTTDRTIVGFNDRQATTEDDIIAWYERAKLQC